MLWSGIAERSLPVRISILNFGTEDGRLILKNTLYSNNERDKEKTNSYLRFYGLYRTQALQVIEEHSELYEVYALTAYNKVDLLIAQARKFLPEAVVIANEEKYVQLKEALSDLPVKVYAGTAALCQIVESGPIDVVLTAMVGYAGLKPT